MLRYMLDTDICIRVLRDRPAGLRMHFNKNAASLCVSSVTVGELAYGAAKSADPTGKRNDVESFLTRLTVLAFDDEAAWHFGEIRADLERRGCVIGSYDLMIAGHARSRGLTVVTGNLREFQRVSGLRSDDWLDPSV